jgi:hypothetical protein
MDNKASMIMPTNKNKKKILYIALSKHFSIQSCEKQSNTQSKFVDTAKKQKHQKLASMMKMISTEKISITLDHIVKDSPSMSICVALDTHTI